MVRRTYKGRKCIRKISRNTKKGRRNVSTRSRSYSRSRSRTLTGGGSVRYGTGVGANCHDPNNSIFNTNLLKLFPYKPYIK